MSETVNIWIENFTKNNVSVKEEIEEVKGAISNEKIWALGSDNEESREQHTQNIFELLEYLDWLKEQEIAA